MDGDKCFKAGLWGSIVAAICCFTPVLVIGLGVIGMAALTPYVGLRLISHAWVFLVLMLYGWSKRKSVVS